MSTVARDCYVLIQKKGKEDSDDIVLGVYTQKMHLNTEKMIFASMDGKDVEEDYYVVKSLLREYI